MANPIIIPATPPSGSSQVTLNAYIALATAQQALNSATVVVANAILADQSAAAQAQIVAAQATPAS